MLVCAVPNDGCEVKKEICVVSDFFPFFVIEDSNGKHTQSDN